jgi:hypothetical protein
MDKRLDWLYQFEIEKEYKISNGTVLMYRNTNGNISYELNGDQLQISDDIN